MMTRFSATIQEEAGTARPSFFSPFALGRIQITAPANRHHRRLGETGVPRAHLPLWWGRIRRPGEPLAASRWSKLVRGTPVEIIRRGCPPHQARPAVRAKALTGP